MELRADDLDGPKVTFIEMADAHFRTHGLFLFPRPGARGKRSHEIEGCPKCTRAAGIVGLRVTRNFGTAGGAGSAGADNSAGAAGADAGAAGMAGGTAAPSDLCIGKVCDAPPAADCQSATQFQTYDKTGTCDAGTCSYVPHLISCTCSAQSCTTDPCIGLTCASPPGPICKDVNTVTNYAASGTCGAGSCSYAPTDTACPFGCTNGACKADPCATSTCDAPPKSTCKAANTLTTYAASGTCSAGTCTYPSTDTACAGVTRKCKDLGTISQCVACVANTDCSNGGTCNSAGACVCSASFNGSHCEFQVFRGIGVLPWDTNSAIFNISHDGSVVVGSSSPPRSGTKVPVVRHAVRSVNGAVLQFVAEPASLTPSSGCYGAAVDSSGTLLLRCETSQSFLYTMASSAVAVDLSPNTGAVHDISLDGKGLVGSTNTLNTPQQAFRKVSSVTTLLGPLEPGGTCGASATNGDGSVVVGTDFGPSSSNVAARWTTGTGFVALPAPASLLDSFASDVSTDGAVIVGYGDMAAATTVALKWSGAALSPTVLGPGQAGTTNLDGSVIGGSDPTGAMLWNSAGGHTVQTLLGATPDLTSDWVLHDVVGLSDDGKFVVGNGTHGAHEEGWVAHLP